MKKKLAILLIVGLTLAGCCSNPINPADTQKKFVYCVEKLQDKICNAPDSVVGIADTVINLLKPELAILVPGSAPYIAHITATNIKNTGCTAITDLKVLIDFIQGYNAAKVMAAKGMKAAPVTIPVQPLLDWK